MDMAKQKPHVRKSVAALVSVIALVLVPVKNFSSISHSIDIRTGRENSVALGLLSLALVRALHVANALGTDHRSPRQRLLEHERT